MQFRMQKRYLQRRIPTLMRCFTWLKMSVNPNGCEVNSDMYGTHLEWSLWLGHHFFTRFSNVEDLLEITRENMDFLKGNQRNLFEEPTKPQVFEWRWFKFREYCWKWEYFGREVLSRAQWQSQGNQVCRQHPLLTSHGYSFSRGFLGVGLIN